MPTPEVFQYDSPTVTVGPYTFDASTLNAYIQRAWSAFDKSEVKYELDHKAYGDPSRAVVAGQDLPLDCSGYAWWCTFRKRLGSLWDNNPNEGWQKNWVLLDQPIPGCAVRYSAKPGNSNGHVGFVVATGGGNFETLDSSSSKTPPRNGSIRWTTDGVSRWIKNGGPEVRFVVSREALVAVNGVPVKPPLNLYLAAAKHPIAVASAISGVLLAVGFWWYMRRRRSA
jgi:hypothetical protein